MLCKLTNVDRRILKLQNCERVRRDGLFFCTLLRSRSFLKGPDKISKLTLKDFSGRLYFNPSLYLVFTFYSYRKFRRGGTKKRIRKFNRTNISFLLAPFHWERFSLFFLHRHFDTLAFPTEHSTVLEPEIPRIDISEVYKTLKILFERTRQEF